MKRAVTVSGISLIFVLSGVASAHGAAAQPPAPPGSMCSFTLSPPQVSQVDGAGMVTATVTPAGCAGAFRPFATVVCVQGGDDSPRCSQARGAGTAHVSAPYRPGTSYTTTGRGIGALFNDASEPNWQLLGPITAVL